MLQTKTILSTFFLLAAGSLSANVKVNPLPESEIIQYQQCTSDIDCVYVNNGCCDCANSGFVDGCKVNPGEEIAINKNSVEEFLANFTCENVMCTEKARMPMCGDGVVSCINSLCHFQVQN